MAFGRLKALWNTVATKLRLGSTQTETRSTGKPKLYGTPLSRNEYDSLIQKFETEDFYSRAFNYVRCTRMRTGGGTKIKASGCNRCSPNDLTILSQGTMLSLGPDGIIAWLGNRPQSRKGN